MTIREVGNESAGFRVTLDVENKQVVVAGWGFWGVEVADCFEAEVASGCNRAIGSVDLLLDVAGLKPMRDEAQEAFLRVFSRLGELGVRRASLLTTSQLTKLQLQRIFRSADSSVAVEFRN